MFEESDTINLAEILDEDELMELMGFSVTQYASTLELISTIIHKSGEQNPEDVLTSISTLIDTCLQIIYEEVQGEIEKKQGGEPNEEALN